MGLYRVTSEMMPDNPAKGLAGVKTGLWQVIVYKRKGTYVEDSDFAAVHDENLSYEDAREAGRKLEHELNEEGGDWVLTREPNAINVDLERKIRNIIKNEYGFGEQRIESAEIYDRLIKADEDVPELAMDDIFYKLEQGNLIMGIGRLNGDIIRRHGAYKITWVSRYI
jgi:hypothetical protein